MYNKQTKTTLEGLDTNRFCQYDNISCIFLQHQPVVKKKNRFRHSIRSETTRHSIRKIRKVTVETSKKKKKKCNSNTIETWKK